MQQSIRVVDEPDDFILSNMNEQASRDARYRTYMTVSISTIGIQRELAD